MSGESVYDLVDAVEAARERHRVEREEPALLVDGDHRERSRYRVEDEPPSRADLGADR